MIKPRYIYLRSDDGHYEIRARLVSEQNGRTNDYGGTKKIYTGAFWVVEMFKDHATVKDINGCHYGRYGEKALCQGGVKLNKNTILFGASLTGMFKKALTETDHEKLRKQWHKEYIQARQKYG